MPQRMARTGVEPDSFVQEAVKSRKALRTHLRRSYQGVGGSDDFEE